MGLAKRYFEFVEGTSSKFWEVWTDGNEVYTRYGRIGANGATTVKDQGSEAGAKKLYDKLIKEKTGKGYEEKTADGGGDEDEDDEDEDEDGDEDGDGEEEEEEKPKKKAAAKGGGTDYKKQWEAIAKSKGKDLVAALTKEWEFLGNTPACKKVLAHLLTKVKSASVDDGKLVVLFDDQYDGETTVTCEPPATEDVSAYPKSWQTFMKRYDGMTFDHNLDVPTSFNGTSGSGAFEQEYIEESEPELYERAQEKGIEFDVPIDYGQDWIVANPFKKNKLGEPSLYFFSHEGGGFDEPYPGDLSIGAVFLRIMTSGITDKDFFEKKNEDEDEDEDEDSDEDEDADEGGAAAGGTRRFEFSEGSSNKFWEIRVEGKSHTVRFGRIGSDGQTKTKDFASAATAQADADKLIAEKTKKGYEEV
jgi:predicted DNA-binding WGR domain protein